MSFLELLEKQLQKLEKTVPKTIAKEIRSTIEFFPINETIEEKARIAHADMELHADYLSHPNRRFGISVFVVPYTLQEARKYFLSKNPEVGFYSFMHVTFENPQIKIKQEAEGKIGIVFVIVCTPLNRNLLSVSLALIGKNIPWILPSEFVPAELGSKLGTKINVRVI
jgi:hypothetical protein